MCRFCYQKQWRKKNPNYPKEWEKNKYRSNVIHRKKRIKRSIEWNQRHPKQYSELKYAYHERKRERLDEKNNLKAVYELAKQLLR